MLVSQRERVLAQTASGPQGGFRFETVPPQAPQPQVESSGFRGTGSTPQRLEDRLHAGSPAGGAVADGHRHPHPAHLEKHSPRQSRCCGNRTWVSPRQSPWTTPCARFRPSASFGAAAAWWLTPPARACPCEGSDPAASAVRWVLWDGTPLNDPFGGWVYWSQLDKSSLERIEVVPGGGSSLYGSSALGGVIQAFSKAPRPPRLELDLRGGSLGTARADLLGSVGRERWSGLVSSSFFHTKRVSRGGSR